MRLKAAWLAAASAVVVLQHPASAGGWWTTLDLHNQYLGIGETLTVKVSEVLYGSIDEAERAEQTPFYAYLVKHFDERLLDRAMTRPNPKRWWRPLSPVIKVGQVTLFARDANLTRGRAHLSIPDVPPGRYSLMLCDEGCQTPLGNHVPIPVMVSSDPLAAQTARRLGETNERMTLALARVRHDLRQAQRQLRQTEADAAKATEAVARLAETPASNADTTAPHWIEYAGWFSAGAFAAYVIARRQRPARYPDALIERIPDDPRELTKIR